MNGAGQRLRALATAGRTSLWPVPVACVLLALVAGVLVPRLDRAADDHVPGWVSDLVFSGGPGAARTVLDAISSSLITVTSLTFSLTVVTLQLASSQFSPRLLRTFTRDRFVHVTLGIFLATFTYALTVERTVRSVGEAGTAFVPRMSVTVAYLLTIGSVVALVLFLAHLASEIRVETMLQTVHQDASATARAVLGGSRPRGRIPAALTNGPVPALFPPRSAVALLARRSAFLVRVEEDVLLAAAVDADALLIVEALPGASVVQGTPVGWAWSAGGGPLSAEVAAVLQERVSAAVVVGPERTEAQDIAFGLRQLTDVAVKALSPGINDPTTAVHALGHASALLCELAAERLGAKGLHEAAHGEQVGALRVVVARPSLENLLDLAVSGPRRYGSSDPDVLARLFGLLREVAWSARSGPDPDAAQLVEAQRRRLRATVAAQHFDAAEIGALDALDVEVGNAIAGIWHPRGGSDHGTGSRQILAGPDEGGPTRDRPVDS